MINFVSVDRREGYRRAVLNTDPVTGRLSPPAGVTIVADPFHVVGLADDALSFAGWPDVAAVMTRAKLIPLRAPVLASQVGRVEPRKGFGRAGLRRRRTIEP